MYKYAKCYRCNVWKMTEEHHLMNGVGIRKKADKDGLVVQLCRDCHDLVHRNKTVRFQLKAKAQKEYESTHTHEEWMKRYHKNYLGDENETD